MTEEQEKAILDALAELPWAANRLAGAKVALADAERELRYASAEHQRFMQIVTDKVRAVRKTTASGEP